MATFVHKMWLIMLQVLECRPSLEPKPVGFSYERHGIGSKNWIGNMDESEMECMLMDMKGKMLCNTEMSFSNIGRNMKNEWLLMTTMVTLIPHQSVFQCLKVLASV